MTPYGTLSRLEPLEARIAPAIFFVGTDSLTIYKGSAEYTLAADEVSAAATAGATAALLLGKGDSLVFDADNSQSLTSGDVVLLEVKAGKGMAFLTDGIGTTNTGFDETELTGVAVSAGFKGAVQTDVTGSVVQALTSDGIFDSEATSVHLQRGAVGSIAVDGYIAGYLLTGGTLNKTSVGAPKLVDLLTPVSVGQSVVAGSAADSIDFSLNGGATTLTAVFLTNDGEAGASINGLQLALGVSRVRAGDGGLTTDGKAGAGGSINGLTIMNSTVNLEVIAGNGGSGSTANLKGSGGNGGNLSDLEIRGDAFLSIILRSGFGGTGGDAGGTGGNGGKIFDVVVNGTGTGNLLAIASGSGGSGFAKGGNGGNMQKLNLDVSNLTSLGINAGDGGEGSSLKGAGGAGGAITGSTITANTVANTVDIYAGDGGAAVTNRAGSGGALATSKFTFSNVTDVISLVSGTGGALKEADGMKYRAGNGGMISKLEVTLQNTVGNLDIASGAGGNISSGRGSAGTSGAVSNVVVNSSATIAGGVKIHSGTGGAIAPPASLGPITFAGALGNGGNSGAVSRISLTDTAPAGVENDYWVYAGVPLDVFGGVGKTGGLSMSGLGAGTRGGSIGPVNKISLDGLQADFMIGSPDDAGSGGISPESSHGNGGNISAVSGRVNILDIIAPSGGSNSAGKGGAGASISGVNITEVGDFVHLIAAGNGGSGTAPGKGGSISGVKVAGDIGNFAGTFDLTLDRTKMGGLVAGLAGAGGSTAMNGSISKVDVGSHGIAAILAGRPAANALTYQNAVSKLAGIKAAVIGADTGIVGTNSEPGGARGTFTWNEGGGDNKFSPNSDGDALTGDTAIDGLVMVLAGKGGAKLPVVPLKLVEVD